jgi:hypothetical protein
MTDEVLNNPIAESYWRELIAKEIESKCKCKGDCVCDRYATIARGKK